MRTEIELPVEPRTIPHVTEVHCDWCGKEYPSQGKILDGQGNEVNHILWIGGDVTLSFGYGSKYDTTQWIMDICDECFEKELKPKATCVYNSLHDEP